MKNCSEVDALVTAYVDGETDTETSKEIAAHLAACPRCRTAADAERTARAAVGTCRAGLAASAPSELRRRCAAAAPLTGATQRWVRPRRWIPVAAAASLVIVGGGLLLSVLSARLDAALVAQLALDHLKCFVIAEGKAESIDAHEAAESLERRYGWTIAVPPTDRSRGLTLIEARRCLYVDGAIAHLLYRRNGRALSVFVIPNLTRRERLVEIMGHDAVVWAERGRTFVMVGREGPQAMEALAAHVRAASGE